MSGGIYFRAGRPAVSGIATVPYPFSNAGMGETKASLLRFALAYALRRVRLARHRLGLSEEQRYAVADETIRELRRFGGWRELDDPVEPEPVKPSALPARHLGYER